MANGDGSGKGTHISVYIYLMKGENDCDLQWPFEHDVMWRILNWKRDENHIIGVEKFKNAATRTNARVTSSERAPTGYGHPKALSHTWLYSSKDEHVQYLNEDCLCLQVLKVEPPK